MPVSPWPRAFSVCEFVLELSPVRNAIVTKKLEGNFFGAVQLSTSDNRTADSKNATYTGGYDNYSIYLSRAFMGWNPMPGLTFIAGKQANPFYTTDLIYDPEVDPSGVVERIDFDKIFNWSFPFIKALQSIQLPFMSKLASGVSHYMLIAQNRLVRWQPRWIKHLIRQQARFLGNGG